MLFILKIGLLSILFCTSTFIGILISKKYSNRLNILKNLKNALNMFEVKINFSFETIPEKKWIFFSSCSQKYNAKLV